MTTDPELIADLVDRYLTTHRHPALPPFIVHRHSMASIVQWRAHPEVGKPGVYVHYDDENRLFYVGKTWDPCSRHRKHGANGAKNGVTPPARIDLIEVAHSWEIDSLEAFLQTEFPDYTGHFAAWAARQKKL